MVVFDDVFNGVFKAFNGLIVALFVTNKVKELWVLCKFLNAENQKSVEVGGVVVVQF